MSSTLPLPPKPDFEALPSRPPPDRRQHSPRKSSPPRSRPNYGDSYHSHDYRSRHTRGPSRYDSDGRTRDDYHRDDRRHDPRHYEPDRKNYDYRRDYDRDRSRDRDNGRDGRGYERGRDYEKRDYDRGRDHRDRRYDPRNSPPRRRSRSRRRDGRSWSPRRRSASRGRRRRSPTPPPRRSSPRWRSPNARSIVDVKPNPSLPSGSSAPSEPKPSLHPDSIEDVQRPKQDPSPPPALLQSPSSIEAHQSPASVPAIHLDKGKAKVTPQPASDVSDGVKVDDVVSSQRSPHSTEPPRKPSPQPPARGMASTHPLPSHPGLPANPKRSRTSQSNLPSSNSNVARSPNFRMPPIPHHEMKEIVKESLNKEIARLASLNASQKAATESVTRAAERSRHELEMSLLELYAAGERRKAAAAQVEEARAGTLGVGGRDDDQSAQVSDSL